MSNRWGIPAPRNVAIARKPKSFARAGQDLSEAGAGASAREHDLAGLAAEPPHAHLAEHQGKTVQAKCARCRQGFPAVPAIPAVLNCLPL